MASAGSFGSWRACWAARGEARRLIIFSTNDRARRWGFRATVGRSAGMTAHATSSICTSGPWSVERWRDSGASGPTSISVCDGRYGGGLGGDYGADPGHEFRARNDLDVEEFNYTPEQIRD